MLYTKNRMKCKNGEILRRSYTRKFKNDVIERGFTVKRKNKTYRVYPTDKITKVESTCIKDRGLPGKGESIFGKLEQGDLKKYGYGYMIPTNKRRDALKQAIEEYGALKVFHKLNAVSKLTKRTVPAASSVFKEDKYWVSRVFIHKH